jgi:hypothetical protein
MEFCTPRVLFISGEEVLLADSRYRVSTTSYPFISSQNTALYFNPTL